MFYKYFLSTPFVERSNRAASFLMYGKAPGIFQIAHLADQPRDHNGKVLLWVGCAAGCLCCMGDVHNVMEEMPGGLKYNACAPAEFRRARSSPKRSVLPLSFFNLFYKFCRNPTPYFIAADFGFFQNNRPCSNDIPIADFHAGHDDAFCTDCNIITDINACMGQTPALDGMRIQQGVLADNGVGSDNGQRRVQYGAAAVCIFT